MEQINRREFMGKAAAATGALAWGAAAAAGPGRAADEAGAAAARSPRRATDKVTLGKTGITCSLLGVGTGSVGYNKQSNQTRLGQAKFTEMIRHAFDRGITFFDVADQYGSHPFLREALRGLPRDKFVIQSKIIHRTAEEARADLDRFRKELGVDYIDCVLMHVVTEPDWNRRYQGVKDVLAEAKQKGIIRAHGCSCHSFAALEAAAADPWVEVDLARFNPWGKHMDRRSGTSEAEAPEQVRPVLRRMRAAGKGVVGMKILAQGDVMGGGDRRARARESLRFGLGAGVLDAFVIGFESREQIDEILDETRVALAEIGGRGGRTA
jgi:aryl-alcohol dehydrogenase-like predicted oxidoreductase